MTHNRNKKGQGLFTGVLTAYLILILHVLLVAAMGLVVLFFRGVVNYLPWIFAGAALIIVSTIYIIVRQMKKESKSLKEMLSMPIFQDRSVEVKLLGGLASFKMSQPVDITPLTLTHSDPVLRLDAPRNTGIDDLAEVARLLENDLISRDEYEKAKEQIFHSMPPQNSQWSETDQ